MSESVAITSDWNSYLEELVEDREFLILCSKEVASKIGLGDRWADRTHYVSDGEAQKDWSSVMDAIRALGEVSFPRDGIIVGLGGGATTDLAGFVASIWMRGVPWIAIPTTLAAMVDAAIGGKTGINTTEGKNLVGSFHLPISTIIDQSFLRSLEPRDINAGMAEVIKCGMIADPRILELAERWSGVVIGTEGDDENLREMITRSVVVKTKIVEQDFKEQGSRAFLNYGHTLGHALERMSNFELRHGEAVSIGMVFATLLSRSIHDLPDSIIDRLLDLLKKYQLPVSCDGFAFEEILALMQRDKKVKDGKMRFVTLKGLGLPELTSGIDPELLREVFSKQAARLDEVEKEG